MRRTALSIAAVFLTAAAYLYLFRDSGVLLLSVGFILLAVAVAVFGYRKLSVFKSVAVLILGGLFSFYLAFFVQGSVNRAESLIDTEQTFVVRVIEEPTEFENGVSVLTEVEAFGTMRFKFNIYSDACESQVFEGDILNVSLKLSSLNQSLRKYSYPDKVYVSAYCKSAEVIGHKDSLYTYCIDLRRSIRKAIESYTYGDVAALLQGVLLGDISLMSDELYDDFKATGVAHITAVSGMHIGALCIMITTALGKLFGRRKASLIAILPMLLVVMLAGFTPSAVRAGIMCLIMLLSQALLKKADGLNSLGVAVAVMLCYNPFYICSLSFQLSCSAAAGVILFSPFGNRLTDRIVPFDIKYVSRVLKATVDLLFQSVGAVLFTLPFQITEFGYISLVAPIANILICAASVYMMVLTILGVIFHFVRFIPLLTELLFHLAEILARYTVVAVGVLSEIPFSYIPFGSFYAIVWVSFSATLVAVWLMLGKPGSVKLIALLVAALLLVSLWSNELFSKDVIEVAVLSVGDGLCTVISNQNRCVIIGCGDDYYDSFTLREHLKQRGITVAELWLIPSNADICFNGYKSINKNIDVNINTTAVPSNNNELSSLEGAVRFETDEVLTALFGKIKIKPIFIDNSCVFEVTAFDKSFAVGCTGYNAEGFGLHNVDFVITGRALPKNINCDFAIVSAGDGGYCVTSAERTLVTCERTLSVKLKKGKGMTIYAR